MPTTPKNQVPDPGKLIPKGGEGMRERFDEKFTTNKNHGIGAASMLHQPIPKHRLTKIVYNDVIAFIESELASLRRGLAARVRGMRANVPPEHRAGSAVGMRNDLIEEIAKLLDAPGAGERE